MRFIYSNHQSINISGSLHFVRTLKAFIINTFCLRFTNSISIYEMRNQHELIIEYSQGMIRQRLKGSPVYPGGQLQTG